MDMGTASRIVKCSAAAVVLLMVLLPMNPGVFQPVTVQEGVPSVYDLKDMDFDNLVRNVGLVIDDRDGYFLAYGGSVRTLTSGNIDEVCRDALSSGEPTASVLGPDGDVTRQERVEVRDKAGAAVTFCIATDDGGKPSDDSRISVSVGDGDDVTIPLAKNVRQDGDGIYVTVRLPWIVYLIASAADCKLVVSVSDSLSGLVECERTLSFDLGETAYRFDSAGGELTFDSGVAGMSKGSLGGIEAVSDGKTFKICCQGSLSDALRNLGAGDAVMTMDDDSATVSKEQALGLSRAMAKLEAAG